MPSNPPKFSLVVHNINSPNSITTATTASSAANNNNTSTMPPHKQVQKRYPLTSATQVPNVVSCHHTHFVSPNQCCSVVVQQIAAPVSIVWSVVRRFNNSQAYKHFVKSCHVVVGDKDVDTLHEVHIISGLPVANKTKALQVVPPRLVLRLQRSVVQVWCTKEDGQSEQPPPITTNP
ncbi:abscisic acid receptor PYL6-like [Vitis riparia]|uniref:abscisic acid receptor PYL6-like n=1 Tax=Vitis riparia TaxID=96939 RepID=UPI00155B1D81|nr:abscisic acid receptor PYL6-like [Vitis riparia]